MSFRLARALRLREGRKVVGRSLMAVPVVKFLEHCEPPTLVKINVENVARFAFLAKRGNAMIPAYVLLEDRCEVFNLAGSVGFTPL